MSSRNKVGEGLPHIVDLIKNREIALVLNTPYGKKERKDDSSIRAAAVHANVPCITTSPASRPSSARSPPCTATRSSCAASRATTNAWAPRRSGRQASGYSSSRTAGASETCGLNRDDHGVRPLAAGAPRLDRP